MVTGGTAESHSGGGGGQTFRLSFLNSNKDAPSILWSFQVCTAPGRQTPLREGSHYHSGAEELISLAADATGIHSGQLACGGEERLEHLILTNGFCLPTTGKQTFQDMWLIT